MYHIPYNNCARNQLQNAISRKGPYRSDLTGMSIYVSFLYKRSPGLAWGGGFGLSRGLPPPRALLWNAEYHGTMEPWYHGTMVPWYLGTMVPWYHGTSVPRGNFLFQVF